MSVKRSNHGPYYQRHKERLDDLRCFHPAYANHAQIRPGMVLGSNAFCFDIFCKSNALDLILPYQSGFFQFCFHSVHRVIPYELWLT